MINSFVQSVLTTLVGSEFMTTYTWFAPMVTAFISSSMIVMLFKVAIFPIRSLFNYVMHLGDKNEKE